MTCTNLGNMIVCTNPIGRLHVGNRYVWVDYHTHCGPSFSYDANGEKPYDPVDENDPVWPAFGAWLARFKTKFSRDAQRPRLHRIVRLQANERRMH